MKKVRHVALGAVFLVMAGFFGGTTASAQGVGAGYGLADNLPPPPPECGNPGAGGCYTCGSIVICLAR